MPFNQQDEREPNDRLPQVDTIPVKDLLKIISVFLLFFSPCVWLITWLAGMVKP